MALNQDSDKKSNRSHLQSETIQADRHNFKNFEDSVTLDDDPHRSIWKVLLDELFPHWFLDHLDRSSLKVVLRTWLQYWVCCLLTIIHRSSHWLGSSGYVINIGSAIEASGSISIATSILIGTAAVSFLFYGVLCATVANAITWHIRGYPSKQDAMRELAERGLCTFGDETCLIEQIERGIFLATKCSVIHIIAMVWALTSIGWFCSKYKIFFLSWYFFSIPLSLSCVGTVAIPYFDPWFYARPIVVPIAISSCARVFFSATIFPTSSNSKFLEKIIDTTQSTGQVLAELIIQRQDLKPSDRDFIQTYGKTRKRLHSLFKLRQQVHLDKIMSRFEICYSRILPRKLVQIQSLALDIGSATSDHLFFYIEIQKHVHAQSSTMTPTRSEIHKLHRYVSKDKVLDNRFLKPYKRVGEFEREMKNQYSHLLTDHAPELTLDDLDELFLTVSNHYSAIAESTHRLLGVIADWLKEANSWRTYTLLNSNSWRKREKGQLACARALLEAMEDLDECVKNDQPCSIEHLACAGKRPDFVREMTSYYGFASVTLAKRIILLAKLLEEIDQRRPAPTLVAPWTDRKMPFMALFRGFNLISEVDNPEEGGNFEEFNPHYRVEARNPDCTPPRNRVDLAGRAVERIWSFLTDEIVLFALKRGLFTTMAYIPVYCRSTTHLYFSKRLGWVSAMIALTVSRQAVDGIYGFVIRTLFTGYGCAVGCAGYYIARGNPYGHAAVMAVLFAYLSWHRHFCNHLNAVSSIILSLSIVIVCDGSYAAKVDHPTGLELSPGFNIAWVRALCVIIGLFIALIGTFFPKPYTGKRAIRNIEGVMMSQITDLAASIKNFSMARFNKPDVHADTVSGIVENKVVKIFTVSQSADLLTQFLRFEPPLGGRWPKNRYKILTNTQQEITQLLWMVYLMFDEVSEPHKTIPHLLWQLGWTNPTLSQSTYSLLYMSARAIVSKEPLPAISPCYLSEIYADAFHHKIKNPKSKLQGPDAHLSHVARIMARLLYERLDGLMLIVKGLVGETFDADTRVFRFDEEFREDLAYL